MDAIKLQNLWNDLPIGKENSVSYSELTTRWDLSSRRVRLLLHELSCFDSGDGYVLIRSSKNKGFYKTNDLTEIENYKKECLNKGRNVLAPIKQINKILNANNQQHSFNNNLRVVREDRGLKQLEVCFYLYKQYDISSIDVPLLSKFENGVCLPTPEQLQKLSEIYNCEPKDLINADLYF